MTTPALHVESRRWRDPPHQPLQLVRRDAQSRLALPHRRLKLQSRNLRPHQFDLRQIAGPHPSFVHVYDRFERLQILARQREIILGLQNIDERILDIERQRARGVQKL